MCNNMKVDEQDTRQWKDLNQIDIETLVLTYREHGKYCTNLSVSMSEIIFNWLFILNSGGLIGVVTIFASSSNKESILIKLVPSMAAWFAIGIVLIYIAAQFEQWRFEKKGTIVDNAFDSLKIGKINVGEYSRRIYSGVFPWGWLINLIEFFSFISFCFGLLIGFSFNYLGFKMMIDNVCLHYHVCLYLLSSK